MADKKILVDFDYDNIVIIDPNKTVGTNGNSYDERLVQHEELVMYANLEARVIPGTKLVQGSTLDDSIRNVKIAQINFLNPGGKGYFSNEYTDELTGKNSLKGQGINQNFQKGRVFQDAQGNNTIERYQTTGNIQDTELLGIEAITVSNDRSFTPVVNVRLIDVQGRALFEKGDNSPYAAFFNLPYPTFYLTMKGYYGKAIRYELILQNFEASFQGSTGDYTINLKFFAYKYSVLAETSVAYLFALPHMYNTTYNISPPSNTQAQNAALVTNGNTNTNVNQVVTSKGLQKLKEVYQDYKSQRLVDENFPEMTLNQLQIKLEKLEENLLATFGKQDFSSLSDVDSYKKNLISYQNSVYSTDLSSWSTKFVDTSLYYYDNTGKKFYLYRENVRQSQQNMKDAEVLLDKIVKEYNKILSDNKTLGNGGSAVINNLKKLVTGLNNDIKVETIIRDLGTIDEQKTLFDRLKREPTSAETENFRIEINKLKFSNTSIKINGIVNNQPDNSTESETGPVKLPQKVVYFEGEGTFVDLIQKLDTNATKIRTQIEDTLTSELQKKLEGNNGLGFKPTIRNVCAVVFASLEAFLRLLDDVHSKAWDVRFDPTRKAAILNNENKNNIDITTAGNIPVYPWPQYFVETQNTNDGGKFELRYPGDPSVINQTQAYRYDIWPEVEFVEEYMKGLSVRDLEILQNPTSSTNEEKTINRVTLNAFDYPTTNRTYTITEIVLFIYEIYERVYSASFYDKLNTDISNKKEVYKTIADFETESILKALNNSNPELIKILKDFSLQPGNITDLMRHISNEGKGVSWNQFIRGYYTNKYLVGKTDKPFQILSGNTTLTETVLPNISSASKKRVSDLLKVETGLGFTDLYPFVSETFNQNSLQNGLSDGLRFNKTTQTLVFNDRINYITNFTTADPKRAPKPFTILDYTSFKPIQYDSNGSLTPSQIYTTKLFGDRLATEGVWGEKVISMLNTPFFTNAILSGVQSDRNDETYPYIQAAYLFLNSLPLATLREKFVSGGTYGEYISSVLNKYGSIQSLPYSWIIKYGSIWYRYKKQVNDGIDILDGVWRNFDFSSNYDPTTSSTTRSYNTNVFVNGSRSASTITLQDTTTNVVTLTNISTGFYPKLINDFTYFTTGFDLLTGYTDSDYVGTTCGNQLEIRNNVDNNVNQPYNDGGLKFLNYKPYAISFDINNNTSFPKKYQQSILVYPSFGSPVNEVSSFLFTENNLNSYSNLNQYNQVENNPSIYNATTNFIWGSGPFGYFSSAAFTKPDYYEYIKKVRSDVNKQNAFSFETDFEYTRIDEIFATFSKEVLDEFETMFLDFCRSKNNFQNPYISDITFGNFQALISDIMFIDRFNGAISNDEFISKVANSQQDKLSNNCRLFMDQTILFVNGNPSNFNRRLYGSFQTSKITDPIVFNPYVVGSLPTSGGIITLEQSETANSLAWKALKTYVGLYSSGATTPYGFYYSDNGSYITDFFVDNNIEFTESNVITCSPLIKIYATQKYLANGVLNKDSFTTLIDNYVNSATELQTNIFTILFNQLGKQLPVVTVNSSQKINSIIDGNVPKYEMWDTLKTLDNKWIAGNDYKGRTLFQDVVFLDRANRDIGKSALIDIFSFKTLLNNNPLNMRVLDFFSKILSDNKFMMMPMGAYMNFWSKELIDADGRPNPENSQDLAQTLFGTHLNVDYREARSKIVCIYGGKVSEHLDVRRSDDYRFGNDSFDITRTSENALLFQTPVNKNDYHLSNKVVGFNVDFGTRSQGMFYNINLTQTNSLATTEANKVISDVASAAGGKRGIAQSLSLYNLYKNRSYEVEVTSLGNVMIQPTMYFNLKNVPMFNGPYHIQSVTHQISPGMFTTQIKGVRIPIYSMPQLDKQITSINQVVLSGLFSEIKKKREDENNQTPTTVNITNVASNVNNKTSFTLGSNASCVNKLDSTYTSYQPSDALVSELSFKKAATYISQSTPVEANRLLTFCTLYMSSSSSDKFAGYDYNFAGVTLDKKYGGNIATNFKNQYFCLTNSNGNSLPFVSFASESNNIKMLVNYFDKPSKRLSLDQSKGVLNYSGLTSADSKLIGFQLTDVWLLYWANNLTESELLTFISKNENQYNTWVKNMYEGAVLAKKLGLVPSLKIKI
jgi:hypothetical protein